MNPPRRSVSPGPSGFEDEVLKIVKNSLEGVCRFEEDKLRNLYLYRANHSGKKPVLMLDAHGDEVGFMIHSIRPNGTLRFVTLGGMDPRGLAASEVLVRTVDGEYIRGIIGLRPPHFSNGKQEAAPEIRDLSIDVGARSAEEAAGAFRIGIGEPAVPATLCRFDERQGLFFGKAFDCRIGVAALIAALRRLDGLELPFDVVGVVSSQEEVGDRGIRAAVEKVKPDVAIAMPGPVSGMDWNGLRDATIAEELKSRGIRTICYPLKTAEICFDKWLTHQFLEENGFNVAKAVYVHHELFFAGKNDPHSTGNVYQETVLQKVK